jgi:Domain of unknown function (DUF4598)
MSGNNDLLKRVQAFLPHLQKANANTSEAQIDQDLVDHHTDSSIADSDDSESEQDEREETSPRIQFDLMVGQLDDKNPIIKLLSGGSNTNEGEKDEDKEHETSKRPSKHLFNMSNKRKVPPEADKDGLIKEVSSTRRKR